MKSRVLMLAALLTVAAHAQAIVITGTDIFNGTTPGATFTPSGGSFELKTKACTIGPGCPYTGVGISGGTPGEIDVGKTISATFAVPTTLDFLQLMVLYDGPEFGDVQEIAEVTAFLFGGGSVTAQLRTTFDGEAFGLSATWTGAFGTVANVSPARFIEAGAWNVANPFGSALLTGLDFTAVPGPCGFGACDNQSDYAIESLGYTPIPEPGTLALLGFGLTGLVLRARRRGHR